MNKLKDWRSLRMRPDGIRVKGHDPMYSLMPYFLTRRYDAMNMITLDIPVAPLHRSHRHEPALSAEV